MIVLWYTIFHSGPVYFNIDLNGSLIVSPIVYTSTFGSMFNCKSYHQSWIVCSVWGNFTRLSAKPTWLNQNRTYVYHICLYIFLTSIALFFMSVFYLQICAPPQWFFKQYQLVIIPFRISHTWLSKTWLDILMNP